MRPKDDLGYFFRVITQFLVKQFQELVIEPAILYAGSHGGGDLYPTLEAITGPAPGCAGEESFILQNLTEPIAISHQGKEARFVFNSLLSITFWPGITALLRIFWILILRKILCL